MRRRISWLVVATTSTVVVSFVIPLCLLVRTMAEDRAMLGADEEARNVATLVANLHNDPQLAALVTDLDQRGAPTTAVLTVDGQVLGSGTLTAQDPDVVRALQGEAFREIDATGGRVVLPVVLGDGTAVVRSSVSPAQLDDGVTRAWAGIVGLGLTLLLLALLVAASLGRRVSEPLRRVAGVAHELRGGDLEARAEVTGTVETQELAHALNGLAERTVELLAAERAAVGDLSHRLRTPVTALRLDAEGVTEPALAQRLQDHILVLQRSIDAIVREARRPVRTDLSAVSDAGTTIRERVTFWSALAEDQGRPMTVSFPGAESGGTVDVQLAAEDLGDLVDILIDNVFAHTSDGTPFAVSLEVRAQRALLVVADGGSPGHRADPQVGRTGLGLDIARRTASGCGGSLRTGTGPDGGTRVEVELPLARI